jgi:hypothetical protein
LEPVSGLDRALNRVTLDYNSCPILL